MTSTSRLRRWQALTITLLFLGYAGYYACRSNLSVCMPLITAELVQAGMEENAARTRLGTIVSFGVLLYAFGKFVFGAVADRIGGRNNFLLGMLGSIICTVVFALGGGVPVFGAAWAMNRFVQSAGWVGIVAVGTRWFSYSIYGTCIGIISLSYLAGDAAARMWMGWLIGQGYGWRAIFYFAAFLLTLLFIANVLFLRSGPVDVGEAPQEENPLASVSETDEEISVWGRIRGLLSNPAFLAVCALSIGFTLLRETFNTWTPTYFVEMLQLSESAAATKSAYFPLLGAVSVVLAGFLGDRLGLLGRARVVVLGSVGTMLALAALARFGSTLTPDQNVALVALIGFLLIGPYSYLGGAIAMDFGGKKASGTACGIIDGVGYLAGVLAGDSFARLVGAGGWDNAFMALSGAALGTVVAAIIFLRLQSNQQLSEGT